MDRLADLALIWRRPLAAALIFLAVLSGIAAVRPETAGTAVVVAAHDLSSGAALSDADLAVRTLPEAAVPEGTSSDPTSLTGQRLAGPVRAGEVLTDRRLLDPRDLGGYTDGAGSLATVRVGDAAGLDAVRVGDTVDVVAVDPHGEKPPHVVAAGAQVAARPVSDEDRPDAGAVLTVVTDHDTAVALTAAALASPLAVLTRGS